MNEWMNDENNRTQEWINKWIVNELTNGRRFN